MNANQKRAEYTALAHDGKLHGTIAAATRKWSARQKNKPQPYTSRTIRYLAQRAKPVLVPLGDLEYDILEEHRQRDRRVLWSGAEPGLHGRVYTKGSYTNWRKKSTFRRYLVVESWARVGYHSLVFFWRGQVLTVHAPRGYHWAIDTNGLYLVGRAGDYHPTANELANAANDKGRAIVAKLKENAAIRKQQAKKAKQQLRMVKRAEREGARICLADSLRAGNCRAGSTNWAQRHNLDPSQHYKPSQVLALANGDTARVAVVAAAAVRRHQQEMARGFCDLADHRA